jgi:hypothetical protein
LAVEIDVGVFSDDLDMDMELDEEGEIELIEHNDHNIHIPPPLQTTTMTTLLSHHPNSSSNPNSTSSPRFELRFRVRWQWNAYLTAGGRSGLHNAGRYT